MKFKKTKNIKRRQNIIYIFIIFKTKQVVLTFFCPFLGGGALIVFIGFERIKIRDHGIKMYNKC